MIFSKSVIFMEGLFKLLIVPQYNVSLDILYIALGAVRPW